jgi:hypothetical protein
LRPTRWIHEHAVSEHNGLGIEPLVSHGTSYHQRMSNAF